MKNIKSFFALALAIFLVQNIYAQNHPHHPHREMKVFKIEEFKTDLNLTAEQETAIEKIRAKYYEKRETLKKENTEDPHELHKQLRELTSSQSKEIKQVLTTEQREILAQKLEERQWEHHERMKANKKDRKELHEKLMKYKEENIQPVMLKQRAKLEEKISVEDKAKLDELRPFFKELHENRIKKHHELMDSEKPFSKEEREAMHKEHEKKMEQYKPQFDALHELFEKYEEDIDALLAELEDERKQWKEDMHQLHEQEMGELKKHNGRHGHHKKGRRSHAPKDGKRMEERKMRKSHFLLLDANEEAASNELINSIKSVNVVPNPSVNSNTVNYELSANGPVRVELRDARGNVLDVLFDGEKEAGLHKLAVDVTQQKSGVYYISIIQDKEVVSKKFIIAK